MTKVRNLEEGDLDFAKSLTDVEEWGNSIEDWQRLLRISIPLVACKGDELLGVTTAFDYGILGMIGNVVVSENSRGKGVGQALRIVLTCSRFGPGIYDIILSLNKDVVVKILKT